MKISYLIVFIFILIFPLVSFSANKTFLCNPPQGTRIDYFSMNSINLQNKTFLMGRDRISGMQPQIVINDENQTVDFIIGDSAEAKSQGASETKPPLKMSNMKVVVYNQDQISFFGLVNGAPILATFYPKMEVLIYSQQSIWPGPDYQGARAAIFYSQCKMSG